LKPFFTYGFELDYREFEGSGVTAEAVSEYIAVLTPAFPLFPRNEQNGNAYLRQRADKKQLEHVRHLDVRLQDFFRFTNAKFRFGHCEGKPTTACQSCLRKSGNCTYSPQH
jgi:hypothetical protein